MVSLRSLEAIAFQVLLVAALGGMKAGGIPPPQSFPPPVYGDFIQRVQQVLKLHKNVPGLRNTRKHQEIVDRRSALARNIREERKDAKQGDIFSPEITEVFQRVIQSTFRGPGAPNVRKTIRQGEPLKGWRLTVNGDYPEHLPVTTIPPTLLLNLPQLPTGMEYRIVGHDFVLEDTQARLIVDFIPGALP
jgi:hypothetical protein